MGYFRITNGKGFHIEFDNGFVLSVQIGRGNYGDNYDYPEYRPTSDNPLPPSSRAEIAFWRAGGEMIEIDGDTVKGYVPAEDVMRFAEFLRRRPTKITDEELRSELDEFNWPEQSLPSDE